MLLAHEVGAGKTATMVIAGQELRRPGQITKPLYVVPNHMLDQFAAEFAQLYPMANVLVATSDDLSEQRPAGVRRPLRHRRLGRRRHHPLARSGGSPSTPATERAYIEAELERFTRRRRRRPRRRRLGARR